MYPNDNASRRDALIITMDSPPRSVSPRGLFPLVLFGLGFVWTDRDQ